MSSQRSQRGRRPVRRLVRKNSQASALRGSDHNTIILLRHAPLSDGSMVGAGMRQRCCMGHECCHQQCTPGPQERLPRSAASKSTAQQHTSCSPSAHARLVMWRPTASRSATDQMSCAPWQGRGGGDALQERTATRRARQRAAGSSPNADLPSAGYTALALQDAMPTCHSGQHRICIAFDASPGGGALRRRRGHTHSPGCAAPWRSAGPRRAWSGSSA